MRGRLSLQRGPAAWLLSVLAGLLHTLSAGWPSEAVENGLPAIDHPGLAEGAWLLQWLGVLLWATVLNAHRPGAPPQRRQDAALPSARRAAALGGCFGTTWLATSTWWLYISMHRYGGMPAWLAVTAVLALAAALSLYLAGAAYVYTRWHHDTPLTAANPDDSAWWRWRARWRGVGSNAALFAATWLLAELARGLVFTGFPWAASGYAHLHGPLSGLAPWIGVYGIGAVSAGLAALCIGTMQRRHDRLRARLARLGGLAALVALVGAGARHDFTVPAGELAVSLLQGNVAQDLKFDPNALPTALNWYAQHLSSSAADLAIAPETALPLLPEQLPERFWADFTQRVQTGQGAVLTGMPLGSFETGYSNSVVGLGRPDRLVNAAPDGRYRYDKHHLVPFGEFIPTGFRWFVNQMDMPLGDFARGPLDAPSFTVRTHGGAIARVAPMICYEDLFGEELARRFRDPARAPTVLANVSNLAWFDDSSAIPQHLRIAQLRSLELQRPTVRATNSGATAIIDHRGTVLQALVPRTQGVLSGLVEGREGITPYAWWTARVGLWPLILLALAVVAPCIVARTAQRLE